MDLDGILEMHAFRIDPDCGDYGGVEDLGVRIELPKSAHTRLYFGDQEIVGGDTSWKVINDPKPRARREFGPAGKMLEDWYDSIRFSEPCQCGDASQRAPWMGAPMEISDGAGNTWSHHPTGCSHRKDASAGYLHVYPSGSIQNIVVSGTITLDGPVSETCCGGVAMRATCPYHGPGASK